MLLGIRLLVTLFMGVTVIVSVGQPILFSSTMLTTVMTVCMTILLWFSGKTCCVVSHRLRHNVGNSVQDSLR